MNFEQSTDRMIRIWKPNNKRLHRSFARLNRKVEAKVKWKGTGDFPILHGNGRMLIKRIEDWNLFRSILDDADDEARTLSTVIFHCWVVSDFSRFEFRFWCEPWYWREVMEVQVPKQFIRRVEDHCSSAKARRLYFLSFYFLHSF